MERSRKMCEGQTSPSTSTPREVFIYSVKEEQKECDEVWGARWKESGEERVAGSSD